jgi:hypothetical protein
MLTRLNPVTQADYDALAARVAELENAVAQRVGFSQVSDLWANESTYVSDSTVLNFTFVGTNGHRYHICFNSTGIILLDQTTGSAIWSK